MDEPRFSSVECLMNYGLRFVTLYRRQGSRPSPWKRNAKKQSGCLRRPYKQLSKEEKQKAREKRKDNKHLNTELQRIARDKKAFLSGQCKEIEENNRMGKTRDLFKKIRDKGTFHAKMGTIKDRNGMDLKKKQKILRRGSKNTQKNYAKKIFTTQIITMV